MPQPQQLESKPNVHIPEDSSKRKRDLLAKVRMLREGNVMSKGKVIGGKPNMTYVWLNRNETYRIGFEGLGYVLCRDPEVRTSWRREDGTHQRGDLILYEVEKDLYEAIHTEAELRSHEMIASGHELFLSAAERAGVGTFVPKS